MKLTKNDFLAMGLTLCSAIPGIIMYNKLPEKMAVHFNANNEPDSFMPKAFALFGIPVIMALLGLFCGITSSNDKRTENCGKANTLVRFIIPAIAFLVEAVMILFALDKIKNIGAICGIFMSVFLIIMGNYTPKMRQNKYLGIKTKRTLSDERIWDKTHRLAGFVWTTGGIILLPLFLMELYIPAFILLLAVVLIPVFYSCTVK